MKDGETVRLYPGVWSSAHYLNYEIYLDPGAGWAWCGKDGERVLIISTNHHDRAACEKDLQEFRGR